VPSPTGPADRLAPPPATVAPSITPVPPTPSPEPTVTPPAAHTVRPGDTLLGLALEYGVPMAAIQLQNGMGASTVLRAGDVLSIPPREGWEGISPYWVVYVVQKGDTLSSIARTYGLAVETLQTVNALTYTGQLQVGQQLVLPLDAPAAAYLPTATPTASPPPTPTPGPTAAPPPPTVAPAAPLPADVAAWPRELVRLINGVRAQYGLPPFGYDERLELAAQGHADDCARRGWGSHTGSDGSDVKTRVQRAGYDGSGWGECWAWTQSPQDAVDMWMNEFPPDDAHRRMLLHTWYTEVGAGVAQADWGYYFILDFGRP